MNAFCHRRRMPANAVPNARRSDMRGLSMAVDQVDQPAVASSGQTVAQPISIARNRRRPRGFWSTVAERSGDTAFRRAANPAKAAWRFASRRTPKLAVAALPRCAVSPISNQQRVRRQRACLDSRRPQAGSPATQQVGKPALRLCQRPRPGLSSRRLMSLTLFAT